LAQYDGTLFDTAAALVCEASVGGATDCQCAQHSTEDTARVQRTAHSTQHAAHLAAGDEESESAVAGVPCMPSNVLISALINCESEITWRHRARTHTTRYTHTTLQATLRAPVLLWAHVARATLQASTYTHATSRARTQHVVRTNCSTTSPSACLSTATNRCVCLSASDANVITTGVSERPCAGTPRQFYACL
jgi:hypothetical protein